MSKGENIVERVARVLADRKWPHVGGAAGDNLVKGTPNWKFCVGDATAVIEALMEPTHEMRRIGAMTVQRPGFTVIEAEAVFNAMLRTALSQPNDEGEGK